MDAEALNAQAALKHSAERTRTGHYVEVPARQFQEFAARLRAEAMPAFTRVEFLLSESMDAAAQASLRGGEEAVGSLRAS